MDVRRDVCGCEEMCVDMSVCVLFLVLLVIPRILWSLYSSHSGM